jgi:phospholipid/cholesterol/gamma-HCH transport system ATP-binding protein
MNAPESSLRQGVKIEVHGLRKSYNGQEVLRGLDFEVKPGEVFVIMGPSGSGKSVLLKQLIGLEQPDSGRILVEGKAIQLRGFARPYRAAMVFQSCALLHCLTVGANVGLYLEEHTNTRPAEIARIVSRTLELVGLKGTEHRMPSELSDGMRKRVAIARALVVEPQLILYDKPTCGLDPVSSVEIADIIVDLAKRLHVTSVIVSHDRDLAFSVADRIAMIEDGNIIAVGTPAELRRDPDRRIQNFLNVHFDHSEDCESLRNGSETASWHSTNYTGERYLAGAA